MSECFLIVSADWLDRTSFASEYEGVLGPPAAQLEANSFSHPSRSKSGHGVSGATWETRIMRAA